MKFKRVVKKDGTTIYYNVDSGEEVYLKGYTKKFDTLEKQNSLRKKYMNYDTEELIEIVENNRDHYSKESILIINEILKLRLEILCENCGTKVPANYEFCVECGSKIIKKQKCKNCGEVFELDGNFCPNCGDNLKNQ